MSQRRYACAWCNEKDKKGGYVTVKGYSSTMKHNHAICKEHSKRLHFVVAYGLMNLERVYPVLKEMEKEENDQTKK